jgi:glutathionyl-hydroquinone reductase
MNYINHYKISNTVVTHKGKTIVTSLNSKLDEFIDNLKNREFEVGYIPAGYEHRPDLISNLFYNTVTYDWMILMFNNIKDPFQELNVGDRILLPKL